MNALTRLADRGIGQPYNDGPRVLTLAGIDFDLHLDGLDPLQGGTVKPSDHMNSIDPGAAGVSRQKSDAGWEEELASIPEDLPAGVEWIFRGPGKPRRAEARGERPTFEGSCQSPGPAGDASRSMCR